MSSIQFHDSDQITLQAGTTIAKHLRVIISSGLLEIASDTNNSVGTTVRDLVTNEHGAVRLSAAPTSIYITDATIAAGANVYGATNGKVGTTNTNEHIGIALSATGGTAGEQILVANNHIA